MRRGRNRDRQLLGLLSTTLTKLSRRTDASPGDAGRAEGEGSRDRVAPLIWRASGSPARVGLTTPGIEEDMGSDWRELCICVLLKRCKRVLPSLDHRFFNREAW